MDELSDHELALMLQLEYDAENCLKFDAADDKFEQSTLSDFEKSLPGGFDLTITPSPKRKSPRKYQPDNSGKKISIIDPSWELIDPNPDIHALFLQYNSAFFWGKLESAEVRWSPRMTLCAGLCVYERRGGFCSIRLSGPLLKLRPRKDLVETLLHEMIHAYLFLTHNNKDHDDHGPEFQKHMTRINSSEGTKISIYHSFHDEVNSYRQHWWRCDGTCQKRKPYFGWVKRSMNRAPSARDPWWADHQRTCGGTYTKVREPEGYKKKGEKKSKGNDLQSSNAGKKNSKSNPSQGNDIRNFFKHGSSSDTKTDDVINLDDDVNNTTEHRQKQEKSAKIIDNIGKGLSSKGSIQSASNFLNLTAASNVGEGLGKDGNIHSVGKFLKGESSKGSNVESRVKSFTGSGNKLGGSSSGSSNTRPASGCHNSRLLTQFGNTSNSRTNSTRPSHDGTGNRGVKRLSGDGNSSAAGKKHKPAGIRNVRKAEFPDNSVTSSPVIPHDLNTDKIHTSPSKDLRTLFNPNKSRQNTNLELNHNKVPCPVCSELVLFDIINDHLNSCLT